MFQNEELNKIVEKYRENKLAHAYLIETNNIEKAIIDIKRLVKILNCEHTYNDNCQKCNLCNLVDKNNLPSLKIIEPDGTSIKKNQIETLKIDFGSIPIYSKYNVYIIKNAEKLNASSANAMLKFVEEPTDGILGFFITSNKDIMIDTIKSRCASLVLNYEITNIEELLNISSNEFASFADVVKDYLTKVNSDTIINHKKELLSKYPERSDIELLLKLILYIYYNNYLKAINENYNSKFQEIYEIKENIGVLFKKMQIITKILTNMSYNVNIELILDQFVIEMRGIYE